MAFVVPIDFKPGAVVCNIGHFDNEIDRAAICQNWEWDEVKPQAHKIHRNKDNNDHLLLLSEGRLVNLGNATDHSSRIMDGSFSNRELPKYIYMKESSIALKVLPKKLDEQVAAHMVKGFNGVLTKLTMEQADYINVKVNRPFKPKSYPY